MELNPLAARSFAAILEEGTGQQLSVERQWRIATALQPVMRAHGCTSLDMLALRMRCPDAAGLRTAVVEALLNHETSFFRDRAVFETLRTRLLPALAARNAATRRLRIWSAGCATGQEAHSLAMLLAGDAERWRDWRIDLIATDVSAAAIRTARAGRYRTIEVQRGLAIGELLAHFEAEGDDWRLRRAIAERTQFRVASLLGPPPGCGFDLILCRNVLLYFCEARRREAFARMAAALAPGGFLLLGAGETVLGQTDAFHADDAVRGCYRRAATQKAGAIARGGAMPLPA